MLFAYRYPEAEITRDRTGKCRHPTSVLALRSAPVGIALSEHVTAVSRAAERRQRYPDSAFIEDFTTIRRLGRLRRKMVPTAGRSEQFDRSILEATLATTRIPGSRSHVTGIDSRWPGYAGLPDTMRIRHLEGVTSHGSGVSQQIIFEGHR